MFHKTFEDDLYTPENNKDMVVVRDIEIFSCCEHHLALMYNMNATVAYIPNGKILGLSKIVRIADMGLADLAFFAKALMGAIDLRTEKKLR